MNYLLKIFNIDKTKPVGMLGSSSDSSELFTNLYMGFVGGAVILPQSQGEGKYLFTQDKKDD
jgi:hypothetical protein